MLKNQIIEGKSHYMLTLSLICLKLNHYRHSFKGKSVVEHLLIEDTQLKDRKRKKLPAEAQTWHLSIRGPTCCHLSFNHDPTLGTVVKDILFATGFRTSHTLHFQMWKNPSIKNFRLRMKNESMDESGRGLKSELE